MFDDYTVQDAAIVDGKVKYIMDYRGATVDLGYGANFRMPTEPEGDKVLTHKVDLGYGFTKDVKLTLGSNIKQTFATETENIVTYNAGLTVKFQVINEILRPSLWRVFFYPQNGIYEIEIYK